MRQAPRETPRLKQSPWTPTTERGRQSRQRILAAAERVFGQKGYFPASITDITREAGVAQGTFYVYFKSKRDVFVDVLESLGHLIRVAAKTAAQRAGNRIEAEERAFTAFFTLVNEHPYLYCIARQAEFVDPDAFRAWYSKIVDKYAKRLAEAIDREEIRSTDAETLAYCLLGIADFLGMRWPYWTRKPMPPKAFKAMMSFIRYGMDPARDQSKASSA